MANSWHVPQKQLASSSSETYLANRTNVQAALVSMEDCTPSELAKDDRLRPGSSVHARATLVISGRLCQQVYGRLWKVKLVDGTVTASGKRMKGKQLRKYVTADWKIGTESRVKELLLSNVKSGAVAEISSAGPSQSPEHAVADDGQFETQDEEIIDSTLSCHGLEWRAEHVPLPINGAVEQRPWKLQTSTGITISHQSAPGYLKPIEYWFAMFPLQHLDAVLQMTNQKLVTKDFAMTTKGEIIRFFGALLLCTRFKFGSRRDLWKIDSHHKYLRGPNFGRFISRNRFEALRSCVQFSFQPETRGNISSEEYRWMLAEDFRVAFNRHRRERVQPSELLCVDESISRWYGVGGSWLDVGLPFYVDIARKPESGCEVHNIACGKSGFMMGIEFAKSQQSRSPNNDSAVRNHGTRILLKLSEPWAGTNRHVCADSFFASVEAATLLFKNGLRFTGVVKTATRKFPMRHLGDKTMRGAGDYTSLVSTVREANGTEFKLLACAWVDRNRRYFVSSAGATTPGTTQERDRWRQSDDIGAYQHRVAVSMPSVAETYYSVASQIDRHNRVRQSDIDLERTLKVMDWSFRLNTSILSMTFVDAWLLYKNGVDSRERCDQNEFFTALAHEMIDNQYDENGPNVAESSLSLSASEAPIEETVVATELVETKKRRKAKDGTITRQKAQRRCVVCAKMKSKWVCKACSTLGRDEVFVCHPMSERDCFKNHSRSKH